MRFRIAFCFLAFLVVLYFLVIRIVDFVQLFFEHSGIAITQEQIALAHNTTSPDKRSQVIPRIIHQIYHDWSKSDTGLPEDWEELRKSCLEKNKDWEHFVSSTKLPRDELVYHQTCLPRRGVNAKSTQLWNETSSREFLIDKYSWFLKTYDGYRHPIQRVDAVRYFLLRHFGGIYLDLDNVSVWHTFPFSHSFQLDFPTHSLSIGLSPTLRASALLPNLDHRRRSRRTQQQHPRRSPQPPILAPPHQFARKIQLQLPFSICYDLLRKRAMVRNCHLGEVSQDASSSRTTATREYFVSRHDG